MSVEFKIADWKFELTWKELICRPIARAEALRDIPAARNLATGLNPTNMAFSLYHNKEKNNEFDFAARR